MNKQKLYSNIVYCLTYSVLNHFNYSYCIRSILDNIEDELNIIYTGKKFTINNISHRCRGIVISNGIIFVLYGINYNCYFKRAKFK
ncbi:putative membrane protein [Klebsiella phage Muenster]|nr:putative membrane protein [Klebsiella phage Muenster]